jgi:hypothetical protein
VGGGGGGGSGAVFEGSRNAPVMAAAEGLARLKPQMGAVGHAPSSCFSLVGPLIYRCSVAAWLVERSHRGTPREEIQSEPRVRTIATHRDI